MHECVCVCVCVSVRVGGCGSVYREIEVLVSSVDYSFALLALLDIDRVERTVRCVCVLLVLDCCLLDTMTISRVDRVYVCVYIYRS